MAKINIADNHLIENNHPLEVNFGILGFWDFGQIFYPYPNPKPFSFSLVVIYLFLPFLLLSILNLTKTQSAICRPENGTDTRLCLNNKQYQIKP